MSDMGDMFREMRMAKQRRRHENLVAETALMEADLDNTWSRHRVDHFSLELEGHTLQWWPSSRKWHWCGKTYHGKYTDLQAFIRNRRK